MKCHVCGGRMDKVVSQFPFRLTSNSIVIIQDIPVLQCDNCVEYLIEDSVMAKVDDILSHVHTSAELEIFKFAA